MESTPVSIEESAFIKTIREVGRNGLISLDVDGSTYDVVLQEYQQDPLKGHVVHADFLSVDRSSEITSQVRVDLEGEAVGSKEGGVVQQPLHELTVTATNRRHEYYVEKETTRVGDAPDRTARGTIQHFSTT